MQINILTIFPEIFTSFINTSLIKKGVDKDIVSFNIVNIRDFSLPPHNKVDDTPYGGGAGMVMRADVVVPAVQKIKTEKPETHVIYLSASGKTFTQKKAKELAQYKSLTFVCGRYEGLDQRAIDLVIAEEISIGDYVLMGGEVPAMVITEAVTRLLPDMLGNAESIVEESFSDAEGKMLEAPHYTKPAEYMGMTVPEELLSGHHKNIQDWREKNSKRR